MAYPMYFVETVREAGKIVAYQVIRKTGPRRAQQVVLHTFRCDVMPAPYGEPIAHKLACMSCGDYEHGLC